MGNHWDRSLNDFCPQVVFSDIYTSKLNDSEQEKTHHRVTGVQEDIIYCSPATALGKQKTARSTIQTQFRSENTPAPIGADQILLAFQQLAGNRNSANFNNNISSFSKLPKSLTTTMPTKFELIEDLLQTSLKIGNQHMEEDKINFFRSLMRGDALKTFKNITSPNREILREFLNVFRRK